MIKQMLSLEMLLNNVKMEQGYDFSFNQYCEQLKKHITFPIDEKFKDLFCKKFFSRYNSVDTIMDNFDTYIAMLESDFEIILPLYEKKFLYIQSLNNDDLFETAKAESETTANSSQNSSAKSKSFGSSFPSEMIDHDSLEYATDGTHSISEGDGSSKSNSKTVTKNTVGSRLDRLEKMIQAQQNVIEDCVNEFKHLFIMIY